MLSNAIHANEFNIVPIFGSVDPQKQKKENTFHRVRFSYQFVICGKDFNLIKTSF